MRRPALVLMAGLFLFTQSALPYILHLTSSGAPIKRPDYANVQMYLNQDFAPGFTNSDGNVVITQDSDVMGALNAAIAAWNSIPTTAAQFAPIQTTAQPNGPNVIVMSDTPAIRSMLGPALFALTTLTVSGTTVLNSQIVFNPVLAFSSTGAPNTHDLQATFTKQLGNALGLANSGVIGASLFIFSGNDETHERNLSPDDVAGVSGLYPASGSSVYGTLGGALTLNGSPLRNALVSAVDTGSGTALATLTSPIDGTWSMAAPAGNYLVYAQPLVTDPNSQFGQVIVPYYVGVSQSNQIDTNFQGTFIGGDGSGTTVPVNPGASSDASFSPDPPNGNAPTSLLLVNAVPVGAAAPSTVSVTPAPVTLVSGQPYDILIQGIGIDSTINDSNIQIIGPLVLRTGSTNADKGFPLNFNGVNYPIVRFTVDIPPVNAQSYATLIVTNNGNFASYTGGIVILPPTQ
ncbi:MAG: hypothetical protein ABI165_12145 [Bryobacteraceae bacterium]